MKLHDLKPAKGGAVGERKRVGRGQGSGNGHYAGRGQKGQNARAGGGVRPGFEGGQMPLFRALPKRGFTNYNAKQIVTVNIQELNRFEDGDTVNRKSLLEQGLIHASEGADGLKILGKGELSKKLTVQANQFSAGAKEKIEAAGGKTEVI